MNKRKKQEVEKLAATPPRHGGVVGWCESVSLNAASMIPLPHVSLWVLSYFQPAWSFEKQSGRESYVQMVIDLFSVGVLSALVALFQYFLLTLLAPGLYAVAQPGLTTQSLLVGFLLQPVVLVASSLFNFALFFVFARLLSGKGSFKSQSCLLSNVFCGSMVLAALPSMFALLPLLGALFQVIVILIGFYSFYSYYLALKAAHGLSAIRAAAVVAILFVLMIAALFLVASATPGAMAPAL